MHLLLYHQFYVFDVKIYIFSYCVFENYFSYVILIFF